VDKFTVPPTKKDLEEFTEKLFTEDFTQQAKEKFTFKKIGSFYFIIDTEADQRVGLNGKVFRAKSKTKLASTLYKLREGYKKQLEQNQ
jgi:hypothetical protein